MIYDDVLSDIKYNKKVRISGEVIAIPWTRQFKRLSTVIPGVRKGVYTIITSGTKESKTQLCDSLFVYQPIDWLLNNMDKSMSYKVLYFSLELDRKSKILQAICYRLFTKYDILINPDNLQSIYEGYVIDDNILYILESDEFMQWMEFFENTVEIIDSVKHPTGIAVRTENYAKENGQMLYKEVDDWEHPGGKRKVFDKYVPNNPDEIVVPITDHATLLAEKGKTLYECIKTLSSEYCIKWKNRYKYSPVLIQQQNAESTNQQFTNRGNTILDKVKPSREGLAGCKDTAQDCSLMLGIFSPYKYKEEEYEGWDLTQLRDYHREISIMANRHGRSNATVQAYFNGAINYFRELPKMPARHDNIESIYRFVDRLRSEEESYY